MLGPITGVMTAPLLDLMEAAQKTSVADVDSHAYIAIMKAQEAQANGTLGNLTIDEAAAITLYTAESDVYKTLNQLLRERKRELLKPFFPYLRLLLQARGKLPKHTQPVWRGVTKDLRAHFPKNKKIFWWSVTSTTKKVSTLSNGLFLGKSGPRTQFMIEPKNGVDVEPYAMLPEAEVLLYPGTQLEVVDSMDMGHGLFQVHLRELEVPVQLIK